MSAKTRCNRSLVDAIEVFERLLRESGLQTARYVELRRRYPSGLHRSLATLRHGVLRAGT
jgi:hypothetical protein